MRDEVALKKAHGHGVAEVLAEEVVAQTVMVLCIESETGDELGGLSNLVEDNDAVSVLIHKLLMIQMRCRLTEQTHVDIDTNCVSQPKPMDVRAHSDHICSDFHMFLREVCLTRVPGYAGVGEHLTQSL